MYLDFTDEKYNQLASSTKTVNYENNNTSYDAFLVLLNGIDYETINTLCIEVSKKTKLEPQKVYELIQSKEVDDTFKRQVLETAYEIIHSNRKLGEKVINGKHNASAWITHSLFEGELAATFARVIGLNPDTAMKLGILHDVGRKFDQSFMHTVKGFEYLINQGYNSEAFCTLTHSFLSKPSNGVYKGNRCANCDPAIDGFYVDKNGNGVFEKGSRTDDVTGFLENYEYNPYDIILNISDLMATSKGITSPFERMIDVYSRKKPDPRNSAFFKVCFINALNRLMYSITKDEEYNYEINIKDMISLDEINELLIKVSTSFSNKFMLIVNDNMEISSEINLN